jgi:hypothetical protein
MDLQYIGTGIAADGTGVLAAVLDSSASLSSSPDWTSVQALWTEYRILSYHVKFCPWNKFNLPTTSVVTPIATVLDRASTTALASYSDASGYSSVELHDPSTSFSRTIQMDDVGEANFTLTSTSPANADRMFIKIYSSANTNSIVLYDYLAFIKIQVKGRK